MTSLPTLIAKRIGNRYNRGAHMIVRKIEDARLSITGSSNRVHWLVSKEDGSASFEVRKVSIPPDGKSSKGHHKHEHGVFVLSGHGRIVGKDEEHPLEAGISVYVKSDEEHQWINDSSEESLEFVCVIQSGAEDIIKARVEEAT